MSKIKVLLVDDHPVIRFGLSTLMKEDSGINIVGEADNGEVALKLLKDLDVDVVVMDIKMPVMNGIEATEKILDRFPHIKVLALSMYDEQEYISRMLDAGASGYILKNSEKSEVLDAVKAVYEGDTFFSSKVSSKMLNQYLSEKGVGAEKGKHPAPLTDREKEIIKLISEEMTNAEIGERLNISKRTVDTHRRNLIKKLDVKNTAGLVKYAIKHGLLELSE